MTILFVLYVFFVPQINSQLQGNILSNPGALKPNIWNNYALKSENPPRIMKPKFRMWRNLQGLKNKGAGQLKEDSALPGKFKIQGTASLIKNGNLKLDLSLSSASTSFDPALTQPTTGPTTSSGASATTSAVGPTVGTTEAATAATTAASTAATTAASTAATTAASTATTTTTGATAATTAASTAATTATGATTAASTAATTAASTATGATAAGTTVAGTTVAVTTAATTAAGTTSAGGASTTAGGSTTATSVAPPSSGSISTIATTASSLPTTSPIGATSATTSVQTTSGTTVPTSRPTTPGASPNKICLTPDKVYVIIVAKDILKAHNAFRRTHGSPDMQLDDQMICDAQNYAQEIAYKGALEHQSSEILARKGMGENIGMSCTPARNGPLKYNKIVRMARNVAKRWYAEVCQYNFDKPSIASNTGHFTEVIWSSSKRLGVGYAVGKNDKFPGYVCVYVVGRYSPAGNNIVAQGLDTNVKRGSFNGAYCKRRSKAPSFTLIPMDKRNQLKKRTSRIGRV